MIVEMLALIMSPPVTSSFGSQVVAIEQEEPLGHPLAGGDYLLIAEAARHPKMRGVDLSCYAIYVHERQGARWVSFLAARERIIEAAKADGTEITYLPLDPNCRSISFVMNAKGRVARVVLTRH